MLVVWIQCHFTAAGLCSTCSILLLLCLLLQSMMHLSLLEGHKLVRMLLLPSGWWVREAIARTALGVWDFTFCLALSERNNLSFIIESKFEILRARCSRRGKNVLLRLYSKGLLPIKLVHFHPSFAIPWFHSLSSVVDSSLSIHTDRAFGKLRVLLLFDLLLLLVERAGELAPVDHLLELFIDKLLGALDTRRAVLRGNRAPLLEMLVLMRQHGTLLIAGLDLMRRVLEHHDVLVARPVTASTWVVVLTHELVVQVEAGLVQRIVVEHASAHLLARFAQGT